MQHRMSTLFSAVLYGTAVIAALSLLAIATLVTVDVTLRWTFGRPIVGVFEIATVLLVFAIFLAFPLVQYRDEQMNVDIAYDRFNHGAKFAAKIIDCLAGILVFGILSWAAAHEFLEAYAGGFLLRGMIQVPATVPYGAIAVGSILTLSVIIYRLVERVRALAGPKKSGKVELPEDRKV